MLRLDEVAEVVIMHPANRRPRNISATTKRKYFSTVNRLIEFFGPDRDPVTITAGELVDWSVFLGEKYANALTANTLRSDARAIWNHLAKAGYSVCDVGDVFTMAKEPPRKLKAVTDLNYWRIMTIGLRDVAMACVLGESGMRRNALCYMLVSKTEIWTDIHTGELCLATAVTEKGGVPTIKFGLHLSASLVKIWLDVRAKFLQVAEKPDDDHVWIGVDTGKGLEYSAIGHAFESLKARAKVPHHEPANPHSFRHYFTQKRAIAGMPIPVLSRLLGHASIATTEIYLNMAEDTIRKTFFDETYRPE